MFFLNVASDSQGPQFGSIIVIHFMYEGRSENIRTFQAIVFPRAASCLYITKTCLYNLTPLNPTFI